MIKRQKNGCHSSFIGHLTPKTLAKQHAKTKNTFWGQFPTFSTKTSSSFFMYCVKSTEEYFERKKCGCTLSKNGYLTSVRPPKHHFDQKKVIKKTFVWPDSIKEDVGSLKIPCANLFHYNIERNCVSLCSEGVLWVKYP